MRKIIAYKYNFITEKEKNTSMQQQKKKKHQSKMNKSSVYI